MKVSLGYESGDCFVVVGLAKGVTAEDDDHLRRHLGEHDRFRTVIASELEAVGTDASGATNVYVYAVRDFDGHPTGQRHRMFLRRGGGHSGD